MRWLRYSLWTLLVLVVVLGGSIGFLVATETGLLWGLDLAQRVLPGKLSYEQIQGRLIGPLTIRGLRYQQDELDFRLKHAEFDWQPVKLLSATLHIDHFRVAGIELQLPPPAPDTEPPDTEPFTLSDIELPVNIHIGDIYISDVQVLPFGTEQPFVIAQAKLQATTEDQTLIIQTLAVEVPQGSVTADGRLTPTGDYPLSVALNGVLQDPQFGNLTLQSTVQGTLNNTLTVQVTTSGLAELRLTAEARQVLQEPGWTANLALAVDDLSRFVPELTAGLTAKLETQGSLQDFKVSGGINTELPEVGPINADLALSGNSQAVRIERLELKAPQHPLSFTAKGDVDLVAQKVGIDAGWQAVAWPLSGEPQIQSPQGELAVKGTPQDYQATLKADLSGPGLGNLQAQLAATGSEQAVTIKELTLRDPNGKLALKTTATLGFTELDFAVDGEWQALAWPLQGTPQVESPTGKFNAKGTPKDYKLQLQADLNSTNAGPLKASLEAAGTDQRAKLGKLSLQSVAGELALDVQGEFGFTDQQFTANGEWQSLSWPLIGTPQVQSPRGTFKANGSLDDYQFELDTRVEGTDVPGSDWQLQGQGSTQAMPTVVLTGKLLEGELKLTANASWLPTVKWQAELQGNNLNPGVHWPEAPGKLALRLNTDGMLANGQLTANVQLADLSGTLQLQTVKGQAKLSVMNQDVVIEALQLQAGQAALKAAGSLSDRWDLNWQLDVPSLAGLLPDAKGTVRSKGQLSGPRMQPQGNIEISANDLVYQDTQVQSLQGNAKLDLAGQSSLNLQGEGLAVAGQEWQRLTVNGSGNEANHSLQADMAGDLGQFALALSGGLKEHTWQGRLTQLEAKQTEFGDWNLAQPVALKGSAEQAGAEQLCLVSQPTRLCVQGEWSAKTGAKGEVQLENLEPARFAALIPENIAIETQVNGKVNGAMQPNGALQGQADIQIAPGRVQLSANGKPVEIILGGGALQAQAEGNNATAQFNFDLGQLGQIASEFKLNELTGKPGIAGTLNAEINDFSLVSTFAPELQEVTGRLLADIALSGSVTAPQIQGAVKLENAGVDVPLVATQIREINMTAQADEQGRLQLSGSARSGSGQLDVTGQIDLAQSDFDITVKGENFQAANSSEIKILLSPDINVSVTPEKVNITGQLEIPEAFLSPPGEEVAGGPGRVTASSDVRIVQQDSDGEEEVAKGAAVFANLRVILGDAVEVSAAGFKGRLKGSLLVEQTPQLAPRGTGNLAVEAGEYRIYGQDFNIDRGRLLFGGGPIDNPGLDLRVARNFNEGREDAVMTGVKITGTLKKPRLDLFSTPAMADSSVLSYLLFGRPPSESGSDSALLYRAAAALGGGAITGKIANTVGLDELEFESGDDPDEASVVLGKYLSPDLYVSYGIGLLDSLNTFRLRYQLTKQLSFESSTTGEDSGADLFYTIER
ncbi:MAG: translocation/assembly module TamB domain-containing protein [Candidatus Competibacteraceae bacterium]|jgi:translocation and assembly module TamB|nr:translocation/assembly module TamB domain-containing protein [Candidatus Competibacteraceae bacterium]